MARRAPLPLLLLVSAAALRLYNVNMTSCLLLLLLLQLLTSTVPRVQLCRVTRGIDSRRADTWPLSAASSADCRRVS